MFFATLIQQLTHQFFTHACVLCEHPIKTLSRLCLDCHQDLPIIPYHCLQCGRFLTHNSTHNTCAACLSSPPPFDSTFALFPYQPPIKQMIAELKFHQQLIYATLFAELFIKSITQLWYCHLSLPNTLLAIPLHPKRLRERGFNQAVEIAKPISRRLGITLDLTGTRRHKATEAQSGLPKSSRLANMAKAFKIHSDYTGQHLAVLDDVITTGITVTEYCQLLKAHGAKRIDVWCVARRG